MPLDFINCNATFTALRKNWEAVYTADQESQWFLSWSWLHQLALRRQQPITVLAYRHHTSDAGYAAFFPIRRQVSLDKSGPEFSTVYRLPGNYWADYTGIICMPEYETQAVSAFSEYLTTKPWSRLYLENMHISDQRLSVFLAGFQSPTYKITRRRFGNPDTGPDLSKAPCIRLPSSFEDYLAEMLGSSTRQRIRRYRRKLEAAENTNIRLCTKATMDDDLEVFKVLWRRRWAREKGSEVDKLAQRYCTILYQALESEDMIMPVMTHHERPVGMIACYRDEVNKTLLFFVAARELSFKMLPIGLLLHAWAIEYAIVTGCHIYDFLRGDETYKYSMGGSDNKTLKTIEITPQCDSQRVDTSDNTFVDNALRKLQHYQRSANPKCVSKLYNQLLHDFPHDELVNTTSQAWISRMK